MKNVDDLKLGTPMVSADQARVVSLRREVQRLQSEKLRLQVETKRLLPMPLVEAYHDLCAAVFGDGLGQSSQLANLSDAPKQPLSKSYVTSDGGLKDQRAIEYRKLVDRRLRSMARDIKAWTNGSRAVVKPTRCGGCGLFVEPVWTFCAYCGDRCASQTRVEGSQSERGAS